jgi:peptidoglycan-associated lipoprotein
MKQMMSGNAAVRWRVAALAILALAVSACGVTPEAIEQPGALVEERRIGDPKAALPAAPAAPREPGLAAVPVKPQPVVQAAIDPAAAAKGVSPLRDPKSILSKRSVYFDFDSNAIREEFRPIIQAHARFLVENRKARVALQGHADERGSREYNLALGQRRADAVRQAMAVLGVGEPQVEAVSFGEERPRALGRDEAAWAENRRVDIVYEGEDNPPIGK